MLFCAGIGTSLLYWATIEWVYYYQAPPFGIEAKSAQAAHWGAMYGLFHWGPMAWALYCLPALPIAYAFHNRKIPFLRISQACRGVIGDRADGPLGKLIDVLFIFGLVGGTGTSLGLGTPILSASISTLLDIERTFALDAFVIAIWTAIFGTTVYLGMEKGIKRLADANVYLGFFLCAFVLIAGPTVFILDTFTNSLGLLVTNFVKMSLYTDPVGQSGFPQTWTVFYWAWWIAYAPFMGLFVARISRGRTVREVGSANLIWGSFGCWLFFAVFGNTALHDHLGGTVPVIETMNQQSPQAAIVAVVEALPMGTVVLILFVAMCFIYSATTLQASAYTIASVASKDLVAGETEPRRWNRLFWAVALGGMAVALMYLGGLEPLQTASLIVAVPLMFVIALSVWSFLRWLKEDGVGVCK
jgi:BCCT family betaine/carnitine transporter